MTNGANITAAFRRVVEWPWLLAALVLGNVAFSVLMAAPLSAMLSHVIDNRPAASLLVGGDDGLLAELLTDHSGLVVATSVTAGAGVLVYGLLSWLFAGGVLSALAIDGERRAKSGAEVVAASTRLGGRMITTGLCGVVLRVVPLGFGALAYAIAHAVIAGRTFQANMMTSMLALLAAAVAWTAVSVAVDYARGLALDDATTKSWRLVVRGLRLLWTRRLATLQLIAFDITAWLAVGLGYLVLARHLNVPFVLLVLRVLAVIARVAITMTTMTAAARVSRTQH